MAHLFQMRARLNAGSLLLIAVLYLTPFGVNAANAPKAKETEAG